MKTHAGLFLRASRCPGTFATLLVLALGFLLSSVPAGLAQPATESGGKILILRNIPSWKRTPDFEDACRSLKLAHDVKPSSEMKSARLSDYRVVVIPGAQWQTGYYTDFARSQSRFDEYVRDGGVLLLELNGAEREGITLPGGATMIPHEGFDNLVLMTEHPAVAPLARKPHIYANLASHGYLNKVPGDALVLVTVSNGSRAADKEKPTYVEYAHGRGRVIAACQCFHDRDKSGRGPLMPAALTYAMGGKWHAQK